MDQISRRAALRSLGLLGCATLAAGCTPVRVMLHWYPQKFDTDNALVDRILASFADSVLPDSGASAGTLLRPFHDERFHLHAYRNFLAANLCSRAEDLYGDERFDLHSRQERASVVENGLGADRTTTTLYVSAIFLTQVAFFSGIYDDESGCAPIQFDGRYRLRPLSELTYPNIEDFLSHQLGVDGSHP